MSVYRSVYLGLLVAVGFLSGCSGEQSAAPGASAPPPAVESAVPASSGVDALLANADIKRGKVLYFQCRACHSLKEGEAHKIGPNLYGFFGSRAGQAPGFMYSEAVANADVIWTADTLDSWLARPSDFLPGNRMIFVGVPDAQDRANLIAFLLEQTGTQ